MLRLLQIGADGSVQTSADPALGGVPPEGALRWLDLTQPSDEELEALGRTFGFHAVALEDCKRVDARPKLAPFEDHLFVVIHRLTCSERPLAVHAAELHAFIGKNYLVTVHDESLSELEQVMDKVQHEADSIERGPDFWYYLVADRIVTSTYETLEVIAREVEDTEEHVLAGAQDEVIDRIFALKRQLAAARRLVSPERELFASLAKWGAPVIEEDTVFYYRSVHDELVRAVESIESHRELLSNALDAHFSAVSQRTNEIMKHLTLLSSIFLPLTFVTGFFGMNFEHLPFASDALMWSGIAACILLPGGMLYWFKTNRWI